MSKEKMSWKQKEQIIFICEILLFVIGSVLFLVSRVENLFNLGLVAIMILFCMNILFSIKNFKENFLYFFMQLTLFTFQISRPFIGMCRGMKWWKESFQKEENIWFALTLIVITETALYIGANIIKFSRIKIRENNTHSLDSMFCKTEFVSNLRKISMVVFYVRICQQSQEDFNGCVLCNNAVLSY
ncbi:O-antigen polysaccharide polymerase Wzy [Ruminococcus sp. AF25-17]|nr:O-antigen polysaccharide polymerase Wzy [Ruminococcus sp. AF25-17]